MKMKVSRSEPKTGTNQNGVKTVSSEEAKRLIETGKVFVIDVHIPEQTHLTGTNVFIPYNEIEKNLDKLPQDKNVPLLVYCRSGSMSREAAKTLLGLGYSQVYDLEGGTTAYKEQQTEVSLTPSVQNLGTVIYGEVAKTQFTLTNFTPAPLVIKRVATSCGCTIAEVEKDKLEPYESTIVKVAFDPAVHKGDSDLGNVTRTIYLETDNPNFAKLTAEITAQVIKK